MIHHVDTVTEVLKEMIRETRTDISEISKQVGRTNGPRTQASSEIMAQKEAREWREKQDKKTLEIMNAIGDLRKSQEMMMRFLRRQSSISSQGDPGELLKIESLSTLKKKKKKKDSDNLERSTSEPTGEGTLKKKSKKETKKKE